MRLDTSKKTSQMDSVFTSSGNPPAAHTPRLTASESCRKCRWPGFVSPHVLRMPMIGLEISMSVYPIACKSALLSSSCRL